MRKSVLLLICCIFFLLSCSKQRLETTFSNQEKKIESFIEKELNDENKSVVYQNGVSRLILTQGSGDSLSTSGVVSFFYAGYTFNGSISSNNLFSTNHQQTAENSSWVGNAENGDFNVLTLSLKEDKLVEGLRRGLVGVKNGEECYILFSGKYGFNKRFGTIDANSAIVYHIWVTGVGE